MSKKDTKIELRAKTKETFEELYNQSLSDIDCTEIEDNMSGFIKCLMKIEQRVKSIKSKESNKLKQ